jgi:hypothetical protein
MKIVPSNNVSEMVKQCPLQEIIYPKRTQVICLTRGIQSQVTDLAPNRVPILKDTQCTLEILLTVSYRRDARCHHHYISTCVAR